MSSLIAASLLASADVRTPSVKDADGNNPSTPAEIQQGRAKAWLNLNGTGTIAVRDSFNVSSMLDNGVGDYLLTFATARPSASYVVSGSAFDSAGVASRGVVAGPSFSSPLKTTDLRFATLAIGTGNADYDTSMIATDGD